MLPVAYAVTVPLETSATAGFELLHVTVVSEVVSLGQYSAVRLMRCPTNSVAAPLEEPEGSLVFTSSILYIGVVTLTFTEAVLLFTVFAVSVVSPGPVAVIINSCSPLPALTLATLGLDELQVIVLSNVVSLGLMVALIVAVDTLLFFSSSVMPVVSVEMVSFLRSAILDLFNVMLSIGICGISGSTGTTGVSGDPADAPGILL